MNKRVIFCWIWTIPIIIDIFFIIFSSSFPIIVGRILACFLVLSGVFVPWSLIAISPLFCHPKTELPRKVSPLTYINDTIQCKQITNSIYEVALYNRNLKIDMTSWIFKKTYIRDIILMYYHLDYYNRNKLKSKKNISKRYFKGQNKYIEFHMLNGKIIKIPMIKKGIEKRSFLCSLKLFVLSSPLDKRVRYQKDQYYSNDITIFYF